MRRGKLKGEGGFTLLEIMVALAIFAILLTTIYGSFATALANKQRAEAHASVYRDGRLAINRMADDLQSAFFPPQGKAKPLFRSFHFGDEDNPLDSIVFSALSSRPTGIAGRDTDQRIVSYFFPLETAGKWLAEQSPGATLWGGAPPELLALAARSHSRRSLGPEPSPLALLRRESSPLGEDPGNAQGAVAVFVENVAWLRLRFHDGEKWIGQWDSEQHAIFAPLPRAVEVSLALYDTEGAVQLFSTAVAIPMARVYRPQPVREVERR